ncbi:MAG TPA: DUF305 domain-containing protein [Pseudolysinimonas sp.]|nr:DUF305 domain-containing protein [Pseudolysinimonas sp.]
MTRGRVVAIVVAAVLLLVGAFVFGRSTAGPAPTPTTDSAAAGFLRDMQVHHAQAVEMALLVRDRTDNETVRTIAYDIAVTQATQSGAMYGLLDAWDLPQLSSRPAMAWTKLPALDGSDAGHQMDSDAPGEMPGLATAAEIDELEAATGDAAVRLFLTLMIAHHEGGIDMADAVLVRTDVPQVVSLASGIQRAQRAEILAMQDLLAHLPAP